MRLFLITIATVFLLVCRFVTPVEADTHGGELEIEYKTAANAINCMAIYYIGTSFAELLYQETGKRGALEGFTELQKTFEHIYTAIQEEDLNTVITKGMIGEAKSLAAEKLGRVYDDNPENVVAAEVTCNAWRKKLAVYLSRELIDDSGNVETDPDKAKDIFRSVPVMPSTPPKSDPYWRWSQEFIPVAFEAWTKGGRMTVSKGLQIIREQGESAAKELFEEGVNAYENEDYATALEKWRDVAVLGFSAAPDLAREAQVSIGYLYYAGKGAPQNKEEAARWFRQAARGGHVGAQWNLGFMYAVGAGVPQNDLKAYMWAWLAKAGGLEEESSEIDALMERMSHSQKSDAELMVRKCLETDYDNCD